MSRILPYSRRHVRLPRWPAVCNHWRITIPLRSKWSHNCRSTRPIRQPLFNRSHRMFRLRSPAHWVHRRPAPVYRSLRRSCRYYSYVCIYIQTVLGPVMVAPVGTTRITVICVCVCVWLAALLWLATHKRGSVCLCLCIGLYDRVCVGVCCMTCWLIISNLVFYSVDRRNWIARLPSWIAGNNSCRAMCRSWTIGRRCRTTFFWSRASTKTSKWKYRPSSRSWSRTYITFGSVSIRHRILINCHSVYPVYIYVRTCICICIWHACPDKSFKSH